MEAGTQTSKRRIYLVALVVVIPLLPVIGWVQAGHEDGAMAFYLLMTVAMAVVFLGLLTRRMSPTTAERTVLGVVVSVLVVRLGRVLYVVDTPLDETRRFVAETIGPTFVAVVLIVYLTFDTRRGLRWALLLWSVFTAMLLPAIVHAARVDPSAAIGLVRQSLVVGVVVGLASILAALKGKLADESARARALVELANTDPLTGVHNRRGSEEILRNQLARFERYGQPLSIAIVDLDRFKERNDHHGHAAGDAALVSVVAALRTGLRVTDAVGRWGGDELLIVAPDTSADEAVGSAERWRRSVSALELTAGPGQVTCSIGIAAATAGDTVASLLKRADRALYRAKAAGGDRAVVDDLDPGRPVPSGVGGAGRSPDELPRRGDERDGDHQRA